MPKERPKPPPKKTECPITREEFASAALPLLVKFGELFQAVAGVHDFSTGSLGWNINEKTYVTIAGKECKLQIGCNITIVGSKELPKE